MDLKSLYRSVIMDHYKNPKNKGLINDEGYLTVHLNNPTCGDDLIVQLLIKDDKIIDLKQQGKGCSICCASASVASELLKNKDTTEAIKLIRTFYDMLTGKEIKDKSILEDALAFEGVGQFPARIKCATLAWKAYEKGLNPLEGEQNNE